MSSLTSPRLLAACLLASATPSAVAAPPEAAVPPDAPPPEAAPALDVPPRVELWTMGPGASLFERFGHSALHVTWPDGRERIYNYGVTDFGRPDLVLAFMEGEVSFWLGTSNAARTERVYRRADRSLASLELLLPPDTARDLADVLEAEAADPAVSAYLYDHFLDNCATRIRDRLDTATGGALRAAAEDDLPGPSFSDHARLGVSHIPGFSLGLDLVLGRGTVQPTSGWEAAFLPDALERTVMEARVRWPDGTLRPLAGERTILYTQERPLEQGNPARERLGLGVLGAAVGLLGVALHRPGPARRREGLLALPAALLLGVLGLLVWGVSIISVQDAAARNELALTLWPLDLWLLVPGVAVLAGSRRAVGIARVYVTLRLALVALAALASLAGLLVQPQLHVLTLVAGLLLLCRAAFRG